MDLDLFIRNKNILIIGPPGSGKTTLSNLFNKYKEVIHTDDFLFHNGLDDLLSKVKTPNKTIVEGSLGYRLLRHGLRNKEYIPDLIINIVISDERLIKVSNQRGKDVSRIRAFNKANQTILSECQKIDGFNIPMWLDVKNDHQ